MSSSDLSLPPALNQSLRRELTTGEHVLWSAQPRARRLLSAFWMWLFAIPWTVFALFWEAMALSPWAASSEAPSTLIWTAGIAMPIFGLPFVLVGLWMLWLPIAAMRKSTKTAYGLTNRRLIRVIDARTRQIDSVMLDQIGPMQRSERNDGSGNLRIETHSRIDGDGDRQTERFEVLGVSNVAQLERLILQNRT